MTNELLCVDTETGGLNPLTDGLCSITFKVVGSDIIKTWFIKPEHRKTYSSQALAINGFSKKFLEEMGQTPKSAIKEMKKFIEKNFCSKPGLLGHNLMFDREFLNAFFQRHRETKLLTHLTGYNSVCTFMMANALKQAEIINPVRTNLRDCYKYFFGEDYPNAHTSEADVLATEKIFNEMNKILKDLS